MKAKKTIALAIAAGAATMPLAAQATSDDRLCTSVIASGYDEDMPDSLIGSALAGNIQGGMHLVTDVTPPRFVAEELGVEGVEIVVIVGGTESVNTTMETELDNMGFDVHRLNGATRSETADLARAKANEFLTGQDDEYNTYCR